MCVAYPAQVLNVAPDGTAEVSIRGRPQRVLLALLEAPVAAGDWLLVQTGLALAPIDAAEAAERTEMLDRLTGDTP